MAYAYIGTVPTKAKAMQMTARFKGLVIVSGIDAKGRYELSAATENERIIDALIRAVGR